LISLCDATSPRFGCDPAFWDKGDRLKCANTTQLMNWASKSVRTDCYEVFAGPEETYAKTYTPEEFIQIHVRVVCYKMLYRGLMMYAVDSEETKVGDWDLVQEQPPVFSLPWKSETHSCYGTVMHASAELKPYHSVIYFKAPPKGTGTITFRALIKVEKFISDANPHQEGDANTGAFYWPMTQDLVLEEEAIVETQEAVWGVAKVGQSCAEYCEGNCDGAAFTALQYPGDFSDVTSTYVCKLPLLSGCGNNAGSYDPDTEFCYYSDATCKAQNRTSTPLTCNTKSSTARFCPCTVAVSGADSFRGAGILSLLLVLPLLFAVNERMAITLLLLLGLSSYASAHNWLNSPSRSHGASAVQPCKPAYTNLPHVQVGPGQAFQIEWMNGHGSYAYFAILHSSNYDDMSKNTFEILDDYIKNAPEGNNKAQTAGYQRLHRSDLPGLNNGVTANFFLKEVLPEDPLWVYRPPYFAGQIGNIATPDDSDTTYLLQYKPETIANDRRVSYESDKYPWLEAVYKFQINTLQARQPDTTHVSRELNANVNT
jgi:hypothetical protein